MSRLPRPADCGCLSFDYGEPPREKPLGPVGKLELTTAWRADRRFADGKVAVEERRRGRVQERK